MGIVTWATLRAELIASIEDPFLLGAGSLDALIPYVYDVQRAMLGEQSFILNRQAAAMLMSRGDADRFQSIWATLPAFVCLQNIAGFERLPEERLAYQRNDIGKHAAKHGLALEPGLGELSARDLLSRAGHPCGEVDWRCERAGRCLSIFFLTTLDRTPQMLRLFVVCAREHGIEEQDIGLYVQPIVQNHGCHIELMVPYDPDSADAAPGMQRLEEDAVSRLLDARAFFSRPYGSADRIFHKNPANFALIRQVKSLFDPNRVLHRGKWGALMTPIDDQAYETLAGIVGERWVERAACVLDMYAHHQNPETMNEDGSQRLARRQRSCCRSPPRRSKRSCASARAASTWPSRSLYWFPHRCSSLERPHDHPRPQADGPHHRRR